MKKMFSLALALIMALALCVPSMAAEVTINSDTAYGPEAQTLSFNGDVVAVTCTNTTGPELPSTGGIGTNHFTTLGTILMLGAGVLLLDQRRRREGTSAT